MALKGCNILIRKREYMGHSRDGSARSWSGGKDPGLNMSKGYPSHKKRGQQIRIQMTVMGPGPCQGMHRARGSLDFLTHRRDLQAASSARGHRVPGSTQGSLHRPAFSSAGLHFLLQAQTAVGDAFLCAGCTPMSLTTGRLPASSGVHRLTWNLPASLLGT